MKKLCKEIKKLIPKAEILFNVNLKNYHTYHIDCFAKTLINITNEKDLIELLQFLKTKKICYFILGNGSNVIFKSKYQKDLIIRLCGNQIKRLKGNKVKCFAGTNFNSLLKFCTCNELGGLEWGARIPASIGGGVIMNMGSFGNSIGEFVFSVKYFNGEKIETKKVKKQDFAYRASTFGKNGYIIISVVFSLSKNANEEIKAKIKEYSLAKAKTQPIFEFSCGSVFKNGEGYYSAKLIQSANLKGFRVGGAEISTLHSNFIINKNGATSKDVLRVIKYVKKKIQKQYNICFLCEVVVK